MRREATCECCRRNDAPEGERVCTSCARHERGVAAGIVRAMARGCLRWDPWEHCFVHVTALENVPEIEVVQSPRRLAEIARDH